METTTTTRPKITKTPYPKCKHLTLLNKILKLLKILSPLTQHNYSKATLLRYNQISIKINKTTKITRHKLLLNLSKIINNLITSFKKHKTMNKIRFILKQTLTLAPLALPSLMEKNTLIKLIKILPTNHHLKHSKISIK